MIKNDRQYRISKAHLQRFENTYAETAKTADTTGTHPLLLKAQQEGLASQADDLRAELAEYDALRSGQLGVIKAASLAELPLMLIQARIASGLSQKELAERLDLKEQQIQRYEANDYAGASLERLREVVKALSLRVRQEMFLPELRPTVANLFFRLDQVGLDRGFICRRLLPRSLAARLEGSTSTDEEPRLALDVADQVGRIFGLTQKEIFTPHQLSLSNVGGVLRFKVAANVDELRLGAYSLYAHHLAHALLDAVAERPSVQIPTNALALRRAIIAKYSKLSFHTTLLYASDLGIVVLPLRDAGAFHGAYLRVVGRHVIILKQRTFSLSRWLFDLLHEIRHAGEQPGEQELTILEDQETAAERRASPTERAASRFGGDVLLDGQAETLAKDCVSAAGGAVEQLKSIVPRIAGKAGVATADLANYVAFRLSLQGLNWWGTAQNLQDNSEDPWIIARDHLLTQVDFSALANSEKTLLELALTTE